MNTIKIQCPAKINLGLKVVNRRSDGFHNIDSIMQTISLYDYLTISVDISESTVIKLSGTSDEIPYDENNLVYKAVAKYLEVTKISAMVSVYIEKNIPVAAGLAGGSTDAAGVLFGLNVIFNNKLSNSQLHDICAGLGSDLNFCLKGGRVKTSSRGEILEDTDFVPFNVNLIKPVGLGISAKEAYTSFSEKNKPELQNERANFVNDLEWAVIDNYQQLQHIKSVYPTSIMTGSGPTYFSIDEKFKPELGYWVKNDLKAIDFGVKICD